MISRHPQSKLERLILSEKKERPKGSGAHHIRRRKTDALRAQEADREIQDFVGIPPGNPVKV